MNLSKTKRALRMRLFLLSLFGFLMFCFCFVSCSQGDPGSESAISGIAVNFRLSSNSATTTRASLADGTTVRVLVYPKGKTSGIPLAQNTYCSVGGGLTPCVVDNLGAVTSQSGSDMYLVSGDYDFYAITPALAVASQDAGLFTADVAQLVDFASSVTSQTVSASAGFAVQLTELERKCAKLTFAVDVSADVRGGISHTSLMDVSLGDLSVSHTAMGNGDLSARQATATLTVDGVFATDSQEPRKASGSFIVLPRGEASLDLSLRARFNGVSSLTTLFRNPAVSVPAFEKGKSYAFTVQLANDGKMKLWLTVSTWNTNDQNLGLGGVPDKGDIYTQLIGEWEQVTWENNLGGVPTGPVITGVNGWWDNVDYHPHLGSDDVSSNN